MDFKKLAAQWQEMGKQIKKDKPDAKELSGATTKVQGLLLGLEQAMGGVNDARKNLKKELKTATQVATDLTKAVDGWMAAAKKADAGGTLLGEITDKEMTEFGESVKELEAALKKFKDKNKGQSD